TATPSASARRASPSVGARAFDLAIACHERIPHGPRSRSHGPAAIRAHPFTRYAGQFESDVSSMSSTIAGLLTAPARFSKYACARLATAANSLSYWPELT